MNRINARYKAAYGECFGVAMRNSTDSPKVKEAEARLDALVEENRKIIPKEWYDYTLLFPGTILNNAVPECYWTKPLFGPAIRPRWRRAIPFLWYRSDDGVWSWVLDIHFLYEPFGKISATRHGVNIRVVRLTNLQTK